ncbi:[Pyruvate dehydrogenase (acetyl-transferring)] kinase isozyme 2 [Dimargaris cristalligena]|uniref:Protein-serine/threonine kinase n=1 Tax=Dimargaris cristalligena TaxID=215637 RepID=A0A4P9ZRS1_9FUNG|nr:[Pyruvate dehydrogenase (acetyl-transferring)] kinase isozyme 2 [Dimargaris cristalligena]RKP35150.1 pyruvate dehydrogenase kinase [Dimargaris cristalligena]|eukprot:RKP35150.1 pyruvate dehydrogenase kinase [Dimargaris cristalligena]
MGAFTKQLTDKIYHFAKFPQTGVSLRQMVKFGQHPSQGVLLKASQFVSEELPIRLARRVVELDNLPHNLSQMPSVVKVKNWYIESFKDLIEFPKPRLPADLKSKIKDASKPTDAVQLPASHPNPSVSYSNTSKFHSVPMNHRFYTPMGDIDLPPEIAKYNKDFAKCLENIKRRHDPVVTTLAQGINEFKALRHKTIIDTEVQSFLDRFYMSRIGIRVLIGQQVALQTKNEPDYVGIICTRTKLYDIAMEAIANASFICEDYYGLFAAPKITLHCREDLEFMYIPSHLHHMLFELLKNSLRATVELYGPDADNYPPIKIVVAEGQEDITIKVSDEGGGISRSALPMVWTYMYTTAEAQPLDPDFNQTDFKAPMAGFGYGLPISRCYARYFGGDLKLISMEGYGTDAYLHLCRLSDSAEPLP